MENSTATSSDTLHKIGVTRTNTESSILAHIETSGRSKKGKRFRSINVARCKRILLAFLSRCLFAFHSLLSVWILIHVKESEYWALLIGVLGLYLEMFVTLAVTKKGEWKWFSPTVFIYLCMTIPCIFLLELHAQEERIIIPLNETSCQVSVIKA
ncbi:transmembrane protein 26-like [Spea bombifrons]|uniref:transmembrane protein 26-like n=1 Tax=Spea bombifrons TaxID=233779 RepID=UPI00234B368D|nr:transmembrane protein 26-like [Spea bombifrons]